MTQKLGSFRVSIARRPPIISLTRISTSERATPTDDGHDAFCETNPVTAAERIGRALASIGSSTAIARGRPPRLLVDDWLSRVFRSFAENGIEQWD